MSFSKEELAKVTCQVLEEAAFVVAQPSEPDEGVLADIKMRITFSAPLGGFIAVESTRAFAATLAANLLGTEPDSEEAQEKAQDALGELLNIVAGVVAGRILGPDQRCPLGPPTWVQPGGTGPVGPDAVEIWLRAEDEHMIGLQLCTGGGCG